MPELVAILSWSARLVHEKIQVVWILPNSVVLQEGLSDAREKISGFISREFLDRAIIEVEELKSLAGRRKLWPGQRRSTAKRILNYLSERNPTAQSHFENWLEAELGALESQDLLGFFWRYKVFDQAAKSGIQFSPDPRTLPFAPFEHGENTPCMELTPLCSSTDIERVVAQFCDRSELHRILGDYSNLDIVNRGALAHILVNELGRNIEEHAAASSAWLCTRLVKPSDYAFQLQGDPARPELSTFADGFLELIICDNGVGLASKVEPVIKKDPRRTVSQKYRPKDGKYAPKDLVDYAFDRLASSKRDIADIVNWDSSGKFTSLPLASGLYWIWSLIRSHAGLLQIRSSGVCGWYNFAHVGAFGSASETFKADAKPFACCGTMIRICLPLKQNQANAAPTPSSITAPRYQGKEIIVWAGHLARERNSSQMRNADDLPPLLVESSPEMALFRKLQREHSQLHDRGILVLNLCGARDQWTKIAAAPLCHFFLHMNYTGPAGSSAVVLWNVPIGAAEVFEKGIELPEGVGTKPVCAAGCANVE